MKRIVVISAGLRSPSSTRILADQLGAAAATAMRTQASDPALAVEVEVIELRDLAHQIADALLAGFAAGDLREAIETVTAADGLVVVSPTFSASYSGLFKAFFDVIEPERLTGLPVLLGATGGSERHSLVTEQALRPLFIYLKTVPVPTAVYAATSDFGPGAPALAARVERAAKELARAIEGERVVARRRGDEWAEDDVPDFSTLLGG